MLSPLALEQIRLIDIKTKRFLQGLLVGDMRSVSRGFGFDFDQIRPYEIGDDVRFIDWNASLRADKLLVKQYCQEVGRTILIMIDVSASAFYSSSKFLKNELMAQVGIIVAYAALHSNDAISLLLFSDQVEFFIAPGKGRAHVSVIINALDEFVPKSKKTNINNACEYVMSLKRKNMVVFVVSDFIDEAFGTGLSILSKKYEIFSIVCLDAVEKKFPLVGFISVYDPEQGSEIVIDARKHADAPLINHFLAKRLVHYENFFNQYGIKFVCIEPVKDFFFVLLHFFAHI